MDERLRFVQDVHRPGWSIAELCRRCEVSRKTGYKWLRAYERGGPAALAEGSHRPHTSPQATPARVVRLILELPRRYTWGARMVRRLLQARVPADQVPTKTTIHRILERHGRVRPRRRSPRRMHPGAPGTRWSSPTRSGPRISKANSAPAMACTASRSPSRMGLPDSCSAAASCSGRPPKAVGPSSNTCFGATASWRGSARINGQPFASNALGRLSTLSVWWVQLGIRPEVIEPTPPEQNGRHERMHKTLKAATARPPQAHLAAEQRCFDRFRERYNTERPHEALGDATPESCYAPSARPYRANLQPLIYPGHYERRLVSRNGGIRWNTRWMNVSHLFAELEIGFDEIHDGLWSVYFGPVWQGRIAGKCYPSPEHNVLPITWTVQTVLAFVRESRT